MKHTKKITIIILLMFLLSQFIGLYVVNSYAKQKVVDGEIVEIENPKDLPYSLGVEEKDQDYETSFISIMISFIIAITILFLLMRLRSKIVLRTWFFIVTIIALGVSITSFLPSIKYASLIGLAIAIPLAISKVYKRNFISHNFSELLIYPGIAAIFVPLLNIRTTIFLLIAISIYDMWAVWKSGIMQKMAKFQMNELNIFSGFFVPYASKKERQKIKKIKQKIKEEKIKKEDLKKKTIKVNVAILGGGDVVFPIITSGVVLKTWGLLPAIAVILGSLLGLGGLLLYSKKKKFYPAMPFICSGIFLGMLISWAVMAL